MSDADYLTIRNHLINPKHKLIFDVAWWTGERLGAVCQLPASAVFDAKGKPRSHITFPARTRKASPDGTRKTRQVPTHPNLKGILIEYWRSHNSMFDFNGHLFPGKTSITPIQFQSADDALRRAIDKAGLQSKGISSHSFRRSFITKLAKRRISVRTIQQLTGHADLKVLSRYIEVSDDELCDAIGVL